MKTRNIVLAALAMGLMTVSAVAQEAKPAPENHFKFYGFIRNYFAYDTRESSAGTEDLYYYMPKDENIVNGEDLNGIPSFRFAALTSRLGVDVAGYEFDGYKIGAKVETDFYSGVSGVTGTAQLRLRQAYVTVAKDGRSWKMGQAWHPMAADLPDIFSLESGAPFGPFSRTPQVTFDGKLGDGVSLTASAIWQMQYISTGPAAPTVSGETLNYSTASNSADYIKYSCIPEMYFGINFKGENSLLRIGADVLSIKPRHYDYAVSGGKAVATKVVPDRLTTVNFFEYGQVKAGNLTIKEKVTYANDGSHMNLVGGYGVSGINSDGSWEYSATRSLSGWLTAQYKTKSRWVPSILVGYIKNMGTPEEIVGSSWVKNSANIVDSMCRIQPEVLYNLGKLQFGLEYMMTAVKYGEKSKNIMAADNDKLHDVINNRIQGMIKFNF